MANIITRLALSLRDSRGATAAPARPAAPAPSGHPATEPFQRIVIDRTGHPDQGCPNCHAGVDHVYAQCPTAPHASPTRDLPAMRRNDRPGRHDTKEFCAIRP